MFHSFLLLFCLGTPSKEEWMEGYKLSSQIGFQFPKHEKQSLKSLIPTASENAISLISEMIKYNPNSVQQKKRNTKI